MTDVPIWGAIFIGFTLLTGGAWLLLRSQFTPTQELPSAETQSEAASVETEPTLQLTSQPEKNLEPSQESSMELALRETKKSIWGRIAKAWSSEAQTQNLEQIEEILHTADLGPKTVQDLLSKMQDSLSRGELKELGKIQDWLRRQFLADFREAGVQDPGENIFSNVNISAQPSVWLIVGVNGAGKTTSLGKLASHLAKSGKKVLVAAGDTFRAAAAAQLAEWSQRAQVEIFSPENVSDPSAVAYQAVEKAKNSGFDVVLIDTAGRLHTQGNLMSELEKVKKVLGKVLPGAPHETLLVLDGSSGQNALVQAREFHKILQVTGVILTKMDGTAKGGVAIGLAHEFKLPIRYIGIGEKASDLRAFSSEEFVHAILP